MALQTAKRLTLTVPEVAELLGVGRNQGYQAAKLGQLPTIKIGRRLLVPRAALEAQLANATAPQGQAKKATATR